VVVDDVGEGHDFSSVAEDATAAERVTDADLDDIDSDSDDSDESDQTENETEDVELVELDESFGPFQAAANVMPYNMAVDPGHNFMNPFIRGYNPAYDGFTPQPGGGRWNNPNGPYWSPFHWSAPSSYWSVYPPQYASSYVNPGMYHAPGMHQFLGPRYNGGHVGHQHGPLATFPYGSMDPHVYGPHLDWPFGALTSDIDHVPGMGAGSNPPAVGVLNQFPQFRQVFDESEESSKDDGHDAPSMFEASSAMDDDEADAEEVATTMALEIEADERAPQPHACVNCQYHN